MTGAAAFFAYLLVLRPRIVRWGAAPEEVPKTPPRHRFLPDSQASTTLATTINAPACNVWPWLVQMGQGRGGFYSYDWLENVFGRDVHSADQIMPDLQQLRVGDTIRFTPDPYLNRIPGVSFQVTELEGNRTLTLREETPGATLCWTFTLISMDERSTRLVFRSKTEYKPSFQGKVWHLFDLMLQEPLSFVMERKMLGGIRQRAEALPNRN
jgi:hypothetical protein